jgi:non-specific serine/threonine protein kinase
MLVTLAEHLAARRLLLILDNCEHVLRACVDLVSRLLRACPRLVVLTTSREVLGLAAETVWRVPPLPVAEPGPVHRPEQVTCSEAAALFVERARAVQPNFAVTPRNAAALLEVCQRLEGIPLAIELAASRAGVLALEQIAERLTSHFRLLSSRDPTVAARQQTLERTIAWSYELLTAPEQRLFDRLSVFAGGWSLEAMESVASGDYLERDDLLDVLQRLVDKSLVLADHVPDPPRYRMLETLRQFGQARLHEDGAAPAARERHATFYLGLAEEAEHELLTDADRVWLRRLEAEHDNLRSALRWLIAQGDVERAQRLAGAARRFWLLHGHLTEGRRWLEQALALPPPDQDRPATRRARAKVLHGIANLALGQSDLASARAAGLASRSHSRVKPGARSEKPPSSRKALAKPPSGCRCATVQ